MKTNEFNTTESNETSRALVGASRQLELCGWCPKAKDNELNSHFYTCELASKDGVKGCHMCIAVWFLAKAINIT